MNILKVLTDKRQTGNIGETYAAKLLRKLGYKIKEQNFVELNCEFDIIAENSEYLVFVEVKTRTLGHGSPMEPRPASAVNRDKMQKMISAAKVYSAFNPSERMIRFDIIEVFLNDDGKVVSHEHLIAAFTADNLKRRN